MSGERLWERLTDGEPLVMDGAMGTELLRPGRTPIGSSDWISATLGAPEQVRAIHRAYAEAGARLHIANTFATMRHVLASAGMLERYEALNRGAVALCRETVEAAAPGPHWVAGSVSTYLVGSDRALLPPEFLADAREMAALLADAGCDMIALEMLFDERTSVALIEAASAAGLPVSIGLTCLAGADGAPHLRGEYAGRPEQRLALADALPALVAAAKAAPVPVVMTVMHSDLAVTDAAVAQVRAAWAGPIGVYPNSGSLIPPDRWDFDAVCPRESFVGHAERWAGQGARFIGGCCGLGPDHIRALARAPFISLNAA